MSAPSTVGAAGFYAARRAGAPIGDAVLRMATARKGALWLQGQTWSLTADAAAKRFRAGAGASALDLRIVHRRQLRGTAGGEPLLLDREVLRPIPAAELAQSDAGPSGPVKDLIDRVPDYRAAVGDESTFWYAFGPVLYRGRLDGSARVLGIASDPGPTECLPFVRRTLVGDSGQKVQGFLARLGLTRSYVLVNAFAVALHPARAAMARQLLEANAVLEAWRHQFYDRLLSGRVQAIVAFGENGQLAYDVWARANPAVLRVPVVKVAHPAAVDRTGSGNDAALKGWARAVTRLRQVVTPDPDGDAGSATFGAYFTENDYARVPRWDLPRQAPLYAGDDSWGRSASHRHNNCCERPAPDDGVSLMLTPPAGQGDALRYEYRDGKLVRTTRSGKVVQTDPFGIPV